MAEANLRAEVVIVTKIDSYRIYIVDCEVFHRQFFRGKIFVLKHCIVLKMPVNLFPFLNFGLAFYYYIETFSSLFKGSILIK